MKKILIYFLFLISLSVILYFWRQAHPFSLSKPYDGKTIRITPKNVGDFTSLIPSLPIKTPVIIDGPYGTFTEESAKKNKILFIAGGIDITPIRSLLEEMAKKGKDIILLYSNKTKKEIVFKNEIADLSRRYHFPVYYFLSQEKDPDYVVGRIEKEKIITLIKDMGEREIFICGP